MIDSLDAILRNDYSHADYMAPPLGSVDFLLLLALVRDKRHGYGIRSDVATLTDGRVLLDAGNLYRSLRRLMEAGLVARADESGRRRYYRLTPRGRRVASAEARRMKDLLSLEPVRKLLSESPS